MASFMMTLAIFIFGAESVMAMAIDAHGIFVPGLVHDVEGVAGLVLLDHHLALCEVHLHQCLTVQGW